MFITLDRYCELQLPTGIEKPAGMLSGNMWPASHPKIGPHFHFY